MARAARARRPLERLPSASEKEAVKQDQVSRRESIGTNIRRARTAAGLSRRRLARRLLSLTGSKSALIGTLTESLLVSIHQCHTPLRGRVALECCFTAFAAPVSSGHPAMKCDGHRLPEFAWKKAADPRPSPQQIAAAVLDTATARVFGTTPRRALAAYQGWDRRTPAES